MRTFSSLPRPLRVAPLRRARVALRAVLALVAFALLLAVPDAAEAYPWMIRHDYGGCATCHADPSGGALLTLYGRAQGDLQLRMRYGKSSASTGGGHAAPAPRPQASSDFDDFGSFDDFGAEPAAPAPPSAPEPAPVEVEEPDTGWLWGLVDLPDWLLLGGSYRHMTIYEPTESEIRTFPMQADLYGQLKFGAVRAAGSLGLASVRAGSPHARAAQVTTHQGDGLNLVSRTHWIGVDIDAYTLRAGRLNLPFGIRIPEHNMWVREATRTDTESDQHHGLAIAASGAKVRGELMAVLGNYQVNPDQYRERGYSGFIELLAAERLAVGASSRVTGSAADPVTLEEGTTVRQAHGLFGRVSLSRPVVLLVEADALYSSRASGRAFGYVGMAQLDFEPVQGLHFAGTGEILDGGHVETPLSPEASPGAGRPKVGGWLTIDWFFLPQLEARIDGIVRQQEPFRLLAQLHFYL